MEKIKRGKNIFFSKKKVKVGDKLLYMDFYSGKGYIVKLKSLPKNAFSNLANVEIIHSKKPMAVDVGNLFFYKKEKIKKVV